MTHEEALFDALAQIFDERAADLEAKYARALRVTPSHADYVRTTAMAKVWREAAAIARTAKVEPAQ